MFNYCNIARFCTLVSSFISIVLLPYISYRYFYIYCIYIYIINYIYYIVYLFIFKFMYFFVPLMYFRFGPSHAKHGRQFYACCWDFFVCVLLYIFVVSTTDQVA